MAIVVMYSVEKSTNVYYKPEAGPPEAVAMTTGEHQTSCQPEVAVLPPDKCSSIIMTYLTQEYYTVQR